MLDVSLFKDVEVNLTSSPRVLLSKFLKIQRMSQISVYAAASQALSNFRPGSAILTTDTQQYYLQISSSITHRYSPLTRHMKGWHNFYGTHPCIS